MSYKFLVSVILSAIFFCFASLYSAEPLVKFYLNDGSTKQYNLSEIDSLGVIDKKNNYVMRIHYDDSLIAYYPTEIIGSIKFENDSLKRKMLNVYIFNYPKSYELFYIDSLIFYIDQYQPLTIGSQVWMLKNLNVVYFRNGDFIPCFYYNDQAMEDIYGKLYNWYAVNDPRGLAPVGWHVPTDAEWNILSEYLGGYDLAGGKLKETGTSHWISPNIGATNSSGFSALPGGRHLNNGKVDPVGDYGVWWSSTEEGFDPEKAWMRYLLNDEILLLRYYDTKGYDFSVRCVKDK